MGRTILISIKPRFVVDILNGKKTLEIRKKFPKDYVGWVYIYCTREQPLFICKDSKGLVVKLHKRNDLVLDQLCSHGKVVARFWCDKVEEIKFDDKDIQRQACLTEDELFDYLFINEPYHEDMHKGYGISITKLEIFDKPKEISEFNVMREYTNCGRCPHALDFGCSSNDWCRTIKSLTRAPQSWCYIEV